jgi:hypothetical protein
MTTPTRRSWWIALLCFASATLFAAAAGQDERSGGDTSRVDAARRPKLTLKAQPPVSITPARVVLTAELVGGADDYEEFYCPTTEWDWGDGTTSESTLDCEPYEAGKSQIKRRFTVEHRFINATAGSVRITFRLKRNDKVLALATANVQVQQGFQRN